MCGTTCSSARATAGARSTRRSGPVRALLPPFTFTDVEAAMGDVPALGQHTDAVLRELGYAAAEIAALRCRRRGMSDFDPAAHRMVPEQRWFDDFQLGERFVLPSRTMTEALFLAFQAASGDNHPMHYDAEYCRAHGMPGMLAHGFQTLIQTAPAPGCSRSSPRTRWSASSSSRAGS